MDLTRHKNGILCLVACAKCFSKQHVQHVGQRSIQHVQRLIDSTECAKRIMKKQISYGVFTLSKLIREAYHEENRCSSNVHSTYPSWFDGMREEYHEENYDDRTFVSKSDEETIQRQPRDSIEHSLSFCLLSR